MIRCMNNLRLFVDGETGPMLWSFSKMSARAMTMAAQKWRAADADAPTLIQDHHPRKKSGKYKGNLDWSAIIGKCPDVRTYKTLTTQFPTMSTGIISAIDQFVRKKYLNDRFDILIGNRRTPEWLDSAPILIRGQNCSIARTEFGYAIECSLYSLQHDGQRRFIIPLRARRDRLKSHWVAAMDLYANGAKRPQLLIHRKGPRGNRKWFVDIPYKVDVVPCATVYPDKIMYVRRRDGDDPGFLSCILNREREPDWVNEFEWQSALDIGERNELIRKGMQNKYRCRVEPSGRKGHGRKRAMEPFEKLRRRRENKQKDFNFNCARYVVEKAMSWKCGTIEMEDLSQVPEPSSLVLGSWPYYELKQRIGQLCEEFGITLKIVKPIEAVLKEQENADSNIGKATKSKRGKTSKRKKS